MDSDIGGILMIYCLCNMADHVDSYTTEYARFIENLVIAGLSHIGPLLLRLN